MLIIGRYTDHDGHRSHVLSVHGRALAVDGVEADLASLDGEALQLALQRLTAEQRALVQEVLVPLLVAGLGGAPAGEPPDAGILRDLEASLGARMRG